MERHTVGNETGKNSITERYRHFFSVDLLMLLVFLSLGLFIIFVTAAIAMQRSNYEWLPVKLVPQTFSNYGVDIVQGPKLAPINPKIIEAVKLDSQLNNPLSDNPNAVIIDSTPTPGLSEPTPTPNLFLAVDIGGPYEGDEGGSIYIAASIYGSTFDLVPGGVSYLWDLDNDGKYDDAQGAEAAVVFVDEGNYPIAVKAEDWLGRIASDRTTVTVSNVPPIIELEGPSIAQESQLLAFQATVTDPGKDVLLYTWDFGDGSYNVHDTLAPGHTFYDDGDYVVRLQVQDNDDGISEETLLVRVQNLAPIVDAGLDKVVDEGSLVTFVGKATDPAGDLDQLSYAWDFNFDGVFIPDVNNSRASTTYIDGLTNVVAVLRVQDEDGGETFDTVDVTVNNVPPQITNVSSNSPVGEGSPLNIQVNATDVGSDTIVYNFDWDNDGDFDTTSQTGEASYIWTNQGNFVIGIEAVDDDGGRVFTTATVSTFNLPPTAVALGPTAARLEGATVQFDGSGSSDPGSDVLTYTWSFGDGTFANTVAPDHIYADNDVYTATLMVADDSGDSDSQAVTVNILNANPTADAGLDMIVNEEQLITFNGNASDPGSDDVLTIAWDFSYDGLIFDEGATGLSVQTIYLDGPAVHNVALRVRDDDYPFPTGAGGEIGEDIDILQVTVQNLPPIVNANGPYNGSETLPVSLSGTASDVVLDMPTLVYEWDVDDDGVFDLNGQTVAHTWNIPGVYTVTLRVTDDDLGSNLDTAQVLIGNALPTAVTNGPYSTTVNLPVTLTGIGSSDPTNDPLSYQWDFGDGSLPVTGITATHIYTDDGVYTAVLLVDDGRGGIDTANALITVNNLPPNAVASATPLTTIEGGTVDFDGSGSSDPGLYDILTYSWDFGDGTPSTNGITTSHVYLGSGIYLPQLAVTDDAGATDTAGLMVTIQNVTPTAVAVVNPVSTFEGSLTTFDGSGSSDPGADIVTYDWIFGDGGVGSGITTTHIYTDNGTYTVELTVIDDDGAFSVDNLVVTAQNVAPNAAFIANPTTTDEGDTVLFDGSSSSDPGVNDTLSYQWDFGDGSPVGGGAVISHTYAADGVYTATLVVADDDGALDTVTTTIIIQNANPVAAANVTPAPALEGTLVNFDGSASSDPGADPLTYQWDFGDGSPPVTGMVATHVYTDDGVYSAMLVVTDDLGADDTLNFSVTVENAPPAVSAGGPYTTTVGVPVGLAGSAGDVAADPLVYAWDLDDDGIFETPGQLVTYTQVITTGTYTVTLQVDDGDGGVVTDTTTVQISSLILVMPGLLYPILKRRRSKTRNMQ
jgi:PKD repeat protein